MTRRTSSDEGAALISSVAGLLVFLALMLFAVQTLIALYTRSAVTDAAYQGARVVAGARVDQDSPAAVRSAQADAEGQVRRLLGRFGDRTELDWSGTTDDAVRLTVKARPPGFLWTALRGPGSALIDRTVVVRRERIQ